MDNSSPSRNVVLSKPSSVTGVTGRSAHWGNCAATSRAATSAVISSLFTATMLFT